MTTIQLNQMHDFTTEQYVDLLRIAKLNYNFIGYRELVADERFVLWRHDCDYSLNRSLQLAKLEREECVKTTYFLNPHCEFYNLLEKGQTKIVEKILALGHDIGLHFDAAYYDIESEDQLEELVKREAGWLISWFGIELSAFSFHNPTEFLLSCERDTYAGLINCYSRTFKSTIPYCSDSNGYWRFRRLREVLENAKDSCLQVLTHPGWWQEGPSFPRERIFRSVYGRANAAMAIYDAGLAAHGRENMGGATDHLKFLKEIDAVQYQLCDYLWNNRMLQSLFIELYRLHERQIQQLCKLMFCNVWRVPVYNVDEFFESSKLAPNGWKLFQVVFGISWDEVSGCSEAELQEGLRVYDQLFHERVHISTDKIEEGCIYLCVAIENVAKWGCIHDSIGYNGITCLSIWDEQVKGRSSEVDLSYSKKWDDFKCRLRLDKES